MSALEAEEVGQFLSPYFAHGGTFGTKSPQVKCVFRYRFQLSHSSMHEACSVQFTL